MDALQRVSSECLLISTHWALLMESGFEKEKYFSREGIVKWQNSLVEDAVEARSTERLRKSGKRTRSAADVEHNSVNTFFFSSRSPWTSYCLGGSHLGKESLCICYVYFNISQSESLKKQVMGWSSFLSCSLSPSEKKAAVLRSKKWGKVAQCSEGKGAGILGS